MKNIFKLLPLLLVLFSLSACSDDDKDELVEVLDVNYANVAGIWQLTNWSGEKLDGDKRYYYIEFARKEENGKRGYRILTNLNSFVAQKITGGYELFRDEEYGNIIEGTYDYTLSTNDEWEYQYVVTSLTATEMKWTAVDKPDETRIYIRCESIPADILGGSRTAMN